MDHKCALCGAEQVWDPERQHYSCSDECSQAMSAEDAGLPESFRKQYRFLVKTVRRLRRDVSALKALNREAFDAHLGSMVGSADGGGSQEHRSGESRDSGSQTGAA